MHTHIIPYSHARELPGVQLVILDFCAPEETASWALLLTGETENNQIVEVTQLLQKLLDGTSKVQTPTLQLCIVQQKGPCAHGTVLARGWG